MQDRTGNRGARRPASIGIALLAVVLLGSACTASEPDPPAAAAASASAAPQASSDSSGTHDHGSEGSDVGSGSTSSSSEASPAVGGDAAGAIPTPIVGKDDDKPGPAPINFPYKNQVPVESFVEPACVAPGQKIDLTVETKPKAAIAYQAMYSDGQAGTAPPFGKGYGGNDKGYSSDKGVYESSWVLAANSPPGPGRVDVFVGFSGKWGYVHPHFAVSDSDGKCPEKWISQRGDSNK